MPPQPSNNNNLLTNHEYYAWFMCDNWEHILSRFNCRGRIYMYGIHQLPWRIIMVQMWRRAYQWRRSDDIWGEQNKFYIFYVSFKFMIIRYVHCFNVWFLQILVHHSQLCHIALPFSTIFSVSSSVISIYLHLSCFWP